MINKLGKLTRPGIRGSPLVAPHASRREIGGYLSSRFVPRVTKINTAGMSPTPPEDEEPKLSIWQRFGQSINVAGIAFFARVTVSDRSLAVPHLEVPDLRLVKWEALKASGFEGCIFDKDNTLTEPYKLELQPSAAISLDECQKIFRGKVVLYSNSAGLEQFDPDGAEATSLESALGIPVLRHREKKPSGGPEDVEKYFGCKAEKLIMIGDRFLTDVAFGNRLGMLTIRSRPFTSQGETTAVRVARAIEEALVDWCRKAGVLPPPLALVPEAESLGNFLRDVSPDA